MKLKSENSTFSVSFVIFFSLVCVVFDIVFNAKSCFVVNAGLKLLGLPQLPSSVPGLLVYTTRPG